MFIDPKIEAYVHDRTRIEPELLQRLERDTYAQTSAPGMLTGRVEGRFLKMLVGMVRARSVLEIGCFTGYSALSMAEALPDDGLLVTCDIDPETTKIALRYFAESPHGRRIELRLGPALDTIATLPGPFDVVFIDADKPNYARYYDAVIDKVRPGGLILLDNSLRTGRVLAPDDEGTRVIDQLNRRIETDPRVENVLLTVRDGLHVAVRR